MADACDRLTSVGGRSAMLPYRGPRPSQLAGIRNFAWVAPGALARGEQPRDTAVALAALAQAGVASVLSLRAAVEEARGTLAAYDAEEQRRLCERHGLRFHRVELVDLAAPEPAALAAALQVIDDEVDAGRPIYVHCVAGVGRTGIVTAAWLVSRGMSGRDAADMYLHFAEEIAQRPGQKLAQAAYFVEKQLPVQWWGLQQIAAALGSPVAERPGDPIAERPPYADGWEAEYAARLRPWRERRAPE